MNPVCCSILEGMGATLVDGLSTLWLMGLKDEFARGRYWVATNLTFPTDRVGFPLLRMRRLAAEALCPI